VIKAIDNIPVASQNEQSVKHGLPPQYLQSNENNYNMLMLAAAALVGLLFISQQ